MAKKKTSVKTESYQHKTSRRKNIPPAKLASEGTVPLIPRVEYSYHPRLPPVLRFDSYGENDEIPKSLADILRISQNRPLKEQEAIALETALRNEPWLEWAGKRELPGFAVDPVTGLGWTERKQPLLQRRTNSKMFGMARYSRCQQMRFRGCAQLTSSM